VSCCDGKRRATESQGDHSSIPARRLLQQSAANVTAAACRGASASQRYHSARDRRRQAWVRRRARHLCWAFSARDCPVAQMVLGEYLGSGMHGSGAGNLYRSFPLWVDVARTRANARCGPATVPPVKSGIVCCGDSNGSVLVGDRGEHLVLDKSLGRVAAGLPSPAPGPIHSTKEISGVGLPAR